MLHAILYPRGRSEPSTTRPPPPSACMPPPYVTSEHNCRFPSLISSHDSFTNLVHDRLYEDLCACPCLRHKNVERREDKATSVSTQHCTQTRTLCGSTRNLQCRGGMLTTASDTLILRQMASTTSLPLRILLQPTAAEILYLSRLQDTTHINYNRPLPVLLLVAAPCRVRPLLATLDTKRSGGPAAALGVLRRAPGLAQVQRLAGDLWREKNRDTRGDAHAPRHGLLQFCWHNQVQPRGAAQVDTAR